MADLPQTRFVNEVADVWKALFAASSGGSQKREWYKGVSCISSCISKYIFPQHPITAALHTSTARHIITMAYVPSTFDGEDFKDEPDNREIHPPSASSIILSSSSGVPSAVDISNPHGLNSISDRSPEVPISPTPSIKINVPAENTKTSAQHSKRPRQPSPHKRHDTNRQHQLKALPWMVYNEYGELVKAEDVSKMPKKEDVTVTQALRYIYKEFHQEVSCARC